MKASTFSPAIFLAASLAGCQATRSPAAEPAAAVITPAVYNRPVDRQPVDRQPIDAPAPIQLVSDTQPVRYPLARAFVEGVRLRVPTPCPRLVAPKPAAVAGEVAVHVLCPAVPAPTPAKPEPAAEKPPAANNTSDSDLPVMLAVLLAIFAAAVVSGFLFTARGSSLKT